MTRPAPEFASMPRWPRCQSLALPSSALYWHIGETTMRLENSTLPSLMGANRLDMKIPWKFFEWRTSGAEPIIRARVSAASAAAPYLPADLRAGRDPDD